MSQSCEVIQQTLYSLAPNIFQTYREHYPQVDLIITSAGTETNVEALRTHRIDVGDLSIFPSANHRFLYILYMKKPIWLHCPHLIILLNTNKYHYSL